MDLDTRAFVSVGFRELVEDGGNFSNRVSGGVGARREALRRLESVSKDTTHKWAIAACRLAKVIDQYYLGLRLGRHCHQSGDHQ